MPLSENKIESDYKVSSSSRRNISKIVLLGDSNVGKTCLIERLVNSTFNPNYNMTIGVNLITKRYAIGLDNYQVLVFSDISGQTRFADIRKSYYMGVEIVMAVCDLTNRETLNNLENIWIPEFIDSNPVEEGLRTKIQLIGNKVDLKDELEISIYDLEETASRIAYCHPQVSMLKPSLLTSAKEGLYINESFGVPRNVEFS